MILIRIFLVLFSFWLFLVILGWFARFWLKRKLKSFQAQMGGFQGNAQPFHRPTQEAVEEPTPGIAQELVPCHQCGTFIDPETAIRKKGQFYCCKEHVS